MSAELTRWLGWLLLAAAAIFFALHFLHLTADFPNNSPWEDWSKYTDEGWYGDAAIRHTLFGTWNFSGDFNPAAALPVWPFLELILFKFTGVSLAAARALTLAVFAVTLIAFYRLITRHTHPSSRRSGQSLAAPICVLLLCTSPFLFVFERMAILEPLLIALTALGLLAASHLHPLHWPFAKSSSSRPEAQRAAAERPLYLSFLSQAKLFLPTLALALIIPAAILTKTTAICLFPAIFYLVWARAGYRLLPALKLGLPPLAVGLALWAAYYGFIVRPHYLADYQYLFSANAYTGFELDPLADVVLNTLSDGLWMGAVLYISFFATVLLTLFWRPRLLSNPLVPALWLWIGGYFVFLAYHNNLQPRYYIVVAVPITAFVAIAIDAFRRPPHAETYSISARVLSGLIAAAVVLAIAIPDAVRQIEFLRRPTYGFEAAAQSIKRLVLADKTHPHLILSISGSDLTLMTGLPSICDDFGTDDLDVRVKKYRPGWYIAWNDVEDDKADAITPLYTMHRVAAYPAMDDPERNLLIVYRLDPKVPTPEVHRERRRTPKPLITKEGQQPSVPQLQH
ncbi:hypothetical protein GOB94_06840 [Granulicella sp. 5B5]|nr:hypothetical protein GOB94_06840 [Granulicella sp. 5B5]